MPEKHVVRNRKLIKTRKNDKYKKKAVKAGNIDLDLTNYFSIPNIYFYWKNGVIHEKKGDPFM